MIVRNTKYTFLYFLRDLSISIYVCVITCLKFLSGNKYYSLFKLNSNLTFLYFTQFAVIQKVYRKELSYIAQDLLYCVSVCNLRIV